MAQRQMQITKEAAVNTHGMTPEMFEIPQEFQRSLPLQVNATVQHEKERREWEELTLPEECQCVAGEEQGELGLGHTE